jgi:hypothetical protein
MADYIDKVLNKGKQALIFQISDELKNFTKIEYDSNTVEFETHKQLDKFVNDINNSIINNYQLIDKDKKSLKDFKEFYDDYLVKNILIFKL